MKNKNVKTVLDIGCGDGELLDVFKKNGFETYGLEPSYQAYQNASKKHKVYNSTLKENLFDKKFDAIILNFVLEHIRDPFNFLNIIITNFLTPGGYILIEIPNDFNLLQTVYLDNYNANNKLPYWIHFPDHLNYWNCFTIIDFIKKFNLEVIYKRVSFPMELFLLFGDDYIKEPKLGPLVHGKRVNFENSFHDANFSNTLSNIYETLFQFNVGRSIELVLNQKKNNNENNI